MSSYRETEFADARLSNRSTGSKTPNIEAELFGPSIDDLKSSNPSSFSFNIFLSAVLLVLTSGLVFLLGVNIIIQYRTMPVKGPGMIKNAIWIVMSVVIIYALQRFNVYTYRKLAHPSRVNKNSYSRLTTNENFEMGNRQS